MWSTSIECGVEKMHSCSRGQYRDSRTYGLLHRFRKVKIERFVEGCVVRRVDQQTRGVWRKLRANALDCDLVVVAFGGQLLQIQMVRSGYCE